MLTPKFLDGAPDPFVALYGQVEQDILANMAERIAKYDYYVPAVQHQHQKLRAMGMTKSDALDALRKATKKSEKELSELIYQAANDATTDDARKLAMAGISYTTAPAELDAIKSIIKAGQIQTAGLFANLTKTTANTASKQFENALDRAWLQISTGAFDYNTAVKTAIKDLSKQGVQAITYPTGHTDSLETAVRRAVVTGLNQTASKAQLAFMDELGVDLVETTAHAGARPEHAEWQGRIFSRSGKSSKYPNFEKATGYGTGPGLCGWNCRHNFFPYVEGTSRAYSDAELKEYAAADIQYNGKMLTEYEATQQQRYIERQIRRWKREETAMQAAGQPVDEAAAKVAQWQARQRDFIQQTGLKRDYSRESIGGGTKSSGFTNPAKQGIIKTKTVTKGTQAVKPVIPKSAAPEVTDAPLTFETGKAANEYFYNTESYKSWKKKLSEDERVAIMEYTDDGYEDLNAISRRMKPPLKLYDTVDEILDAADSLDEALSKFSLEQDIQVYRRFNYKDIFKDGGQLLEPDTIVGRSFSDDGYFSTAAAREGTKDFQKKDTFLQLVVPKGKGRGAYINELSAFEDVEFEFLLARGSSFTVKSTRVLSDGTRFVEAVLDAN